MAAFRKKGSKEVPAISTGSMPDIIFMLIFFFMVTTSMRKSSVKVSQNLPQATEVQKLEKKSLVSFIYIGAPSNTTDYGTEPRIQLNDDFAGVNEIITFISRERLGHKDEDIPKLTTSLKIDKEVKMGIVTDVKQELRKCSALRINYSAKKK